MFSFVVVLSIYTHQACSPWLPKKWSSFAKCQSKPACDCFNVSWYCVANKTANPSLYVCLCPYQDLLDTTLEDFLRTWCLKPNVSMRSSQGDESRLKNLPAGWSENFGISRCYQVMSHEESYKIAMDSTKHQEVHSNHNIIPLLGHSPSREVVLCWQRGDRRVTIQVFPITEKPDVADNSGQPSIGKGGASLPPAKSRWMSVEEVGIAVASTSSPTTDFTDIEVGGCWQFEDEQFQVQRVRLSKSAARTSFAMFLGNLLYNDLLSNRIVHFASRSDGLVVEFRREVIPIYSLQHPPWPPSAFNFNTNGDPFPVDPDDDAEASTTKTHTYTQQTLPRDYSRNYH